MEHRVGLREETELNPLRICSGSAVKLKTPAAREFFLSVFKFVEILIFVLEDIKDRVENRFVFDGHVAFHIFFVVFTGRFELQDHHGPFVISRVDGCKNDIFVIFVIDNVEKFERYFLPFFVV